LAEVLEDVLDRVFRGQDADARPRQRHQRGVERRALARPRRPGDEENAAWAREQPAERLADRRRKAQLVERRRRILPVENPDDEALAVVRRDDRNPQIDAALLALPLDLHPEAAVLRAAAFRDVELRENLEPRDHLARAAVARLEQIAALEVLENTVDAKSDLQAIRKHLDVDVARPPADGRGYQLSHQDVHLRVRRLDRVLARGSGRLFLGQDLQRFTGCRLGALFVETDQRAADRIVRRGDNGDGPLG